MTCYPILLSKIIVSVRFEEIKGSTSRGFVLLQWDGER